MKKLLKRFDEETARIEKMILVAGAIYDDWSLQEELREFFEEEDFETIEGAFGQLPVFVRDDIEQENFEALIEWLIGQSKLGFLIRFATPVKEPLASGCGSRYSWGYLRTHWVYGDTLDQALENGFVWVSKQRDAELEKTSSLKPQA